MRNNNSPYSKENVSFVTFIVSCEGITNQSRDPSIKRPRRECCIQYRKPIVAGDENDVDLMAAIWRQAHRDNQVCRYCPLCTLLPSLVIYSILGRARETHEHPLGKKPSNSAISLSKLVKTMTRKICNQTLG